MIFIIRLACNAARLFFFYSAWFLMIVYLEMEDVIICRELLVLLPRLPQSIVDTCFVSKIKILSNWIRISVFLKERYEKIKDNLEDMIHNEVEDEQSCSPPVINTYLQETGLNVSLIVCLF